MSAIFGPSDLFHSCVSRISHARLSSIRETADKDGLRARTLCSPVPRPASALFPSLLPSQSSFAIPPKSPFAPQSLLTPTVSVNMVQPSRKCHSRIGKCQSYAWAELSFGRRH
ncbi:unnamed protein product [Protopolystoma xenopodis]|uniref:Uncharacterized protein n=1 Tax=Protopolystoma xenopodis TaxID=117903 RepID=A0A448X2R1_9PLAT|nr:unnamed protein product [Protopolystoma xenopodis]